MNDSSFAEATEDRWPIRKIDVPDAWKVVKGALRKWIGIVLHHGAANSAADRHDIQAYANFHVLPVAQGGRGYSDLGYHFGIEEDGGIWISNAGENSRWIWQRAGGHTKAMRSLDGKIVMPAVAPRTSMSAATLLPSGRSGVNDSCVGICFAGDFNTQELTSEAFESGLRLCVELMRGGIHEGADAHPPSNGASCTAPGTAPSMAPIYPHSRFQEKDCPGKKFPFEKFVRTVSVEMRKFSSAQGGA